MWIYVLSVYVFVCVCVNCLGACFIIFIYPSIELSLPVNIELHYFYCLLILYCRGQHTMPIWTTCFFRSFFGNTATPIYVGIACGLFHTRVAEWISCDRDQMAHKAKDTYFLILYRKMFGNPYFLIWLYQIYLTHPDWWIFAVLYATLTLVILTDTNLITFFGWILRSGIVGEKRYIL